MKISKKLIYTYLLYLKIKKKNYSANFKLTKYKNEKSSYKYRCHCTKNCIHNNTTKILKEIFLKCFKIFNLTKILFKNYFFHIQCTFNKF